MLWEVKVSLFIVMFTPPLPAFIQLASHQLLKVVAETFRKTMRITKREIVLPPIAFM